MNLLALIVAAVLAAQTPPSETDKLKAELEKQSLKIAELQAELDAAKKDSSRDVEKAAKALLKFAPPAVPTPVVTSPAVPETKITAVAPEIGLVVISMGADDGVVEGKTYAITRGGESVGTMTIDRVDRKWAAGKVIRKTLEPRVGDTVGAEKAPARVVTTLHGVQLYRTSSDELKAIRKELDDVRGQVQSLTDRILPSWKDVGVTVEEASETLCAQFQLTRGLVVRRVREGSPAARILKANDVITDRTEAQMMEVFRSGGTLPLRRQGKLEVFQVDPIR